MTARIHPQDTLVASCLGMIAQGRPGYEDGTCRFSAGCALGQLIPPERRDEADEQGAFRARSALLPEHQQSLLYLLQGAHDDAVSAAFGRDGKVTPEGWRREWLRKLRSLVHTWNDDLREPLDLAPVLAAAREAGWEVES